LPCYSGRASVWLKAAFQAGKIGGGVWAAIVDDSGKAGGNVGFVVGDDGIAVIAVDQFFAHTLCRQYSHHIDHVAGNEVFASAVVVAHRNVRAWLRTENLKFLGGAIKPELKSRVCRR
jgi:hypothetical protein